MGQRKKRSGQLVWRKTLGWVARIPVVIDGERVRKYYTLHTRDKTVARLKMRRLVEQTEGQSFSSESDEVERSAARGETFTEASERVHKLRVGVGVKNARNEVSMVRRFAQPIIGEMLANEVETQHINAILDDVAERGLGRESLGHMKHVLRAVFKQLKREGEVRENPVLDAEIPRLRQRPKRERAIMTDDEIIAYLSYRPETERDLPGVLERQTMAIVSRSFGGLRTGDLHALDWSKHIDVDTFATGIAPREKTQTPQLLAIPEMLRPWLRWWWEQHGSPTTGPVFPQRRGDGAGKARNQQSHAAAFRRDLHRMMGIEHRVTETRLEKRHGRVAEVTRTIWATKPKSEWSRRQREILSDTDHSLRVDFHSFRRAYNTGLARSGVNLQEAMRLAGHTSAAAHMRYVMSEVREAPAAALPRSVPDGPRGQAFSADMPPQPAASSAEGRPLTRDFGTKRETGAPFTPVTRVQIPQGTPALSSLAASATGSGPARRVLRCDALGPIWLDDLRGLARGMLDAPDEATRWRWARLVADVSREAASS